MVLCRTAEASGRHSLGFGVAAELECLNRAKRKEVEMLKSTLVVITLCCSLAIAAEPTIPDELRQAMAARYEAVCKIDAATWSRLTADEFTVVVPEGKLLTKSERLEALKKERARPVPSIQQETIHRYGDTIVRRFIDDNEWILEIWVQEQGVWRVVAAQVNYIE